MAPCRDPSPSSSPTPQPIVEFTDEEQAVLTGAYRLTTPPPQHTRFRRGKSFVSGRWGEETYGDGDVRGYLLGFCTHANRFVDVIYPGSTENPSPGLTDLLFY